MRAREGIGSMRARITTRAGLVALSAMAALAALPVAAAAEWLDGPGGGTATVCIDERHGHVRVQSDGTSPCSPAERDAQWTVGGEVGQISAEPPLTAERDGGTIQLGLDANRMAAGGRIVSGFADDVLVTSDGGFTYEPVARMVVPAGRWHVVATLQPYVRGSGWPFCSCRLRAGDDVDTKALSVRDHDLWGAWPEHDESMTLQVLHHFERDGAVELECDPERFSGQEQARIAHLKITAFETRAPGSGASS